jgi:hypothetical protein
LVFKLKQKEFKKVEYYVFATHAEAQACLDYINNSSWFPIAGTVRGTPAPSNQKTTNWSDEVREMLSGEWCVDRIPEHRLDFISVPAPDRASFLAAFGQDIRTLDVSAFPQAEE